MHLRIFDQPKPVFRLRTREMDESTMDDGEETVVVLSPIANPLATEKLSKKVLKLVKAGEQ